MYVSKIKEAYIKPRKARLCQGDILRDIVLVIGAQNNEEHTELILPYAIIMTQDCDISGDYRDRVKKIKTDKRLPTILLCPAYTAAQFHEGSHLDGLTLPPKSVRERDKIRANDEMKRYHYLPARSELSIPEMVIDFKHFYTAPVDILYKQRKQLYIGTINELYREELSQRFAYYLSRIGLPDRF